MDNSNVNIDLVRDHVDTIILATLANGDKYGLEMLTEIKQNSKDLYELKQPTLYSSLKRLEKLGYIASYKGDTSNGAQRVYYSLLEDGRKFLENDQYQWEYARTIIDGLLSNKEFDTTKEPPFQASELRPRTKRQPRSELSASEAAEVPDAQIVVSGVKEDGNVSEIENDAPAEPQQLQFPEQTFKIINTTDELKTILVNKDSVIYEEQVDYRNVLDNIFDSEGSYINNNSESQNITNFSEYEAANSFPHEQGPNTTDAYSMYALENVAKKFAEQNITIKPYIKKNTTEFYVNKYLYVNKIFMATSIYSYAMYAVVLMIMHFSTFSAYGTSTGAFLGALFGMLVVPVYAILNYLVNPTKRIVADFSIKKTMSIVSIFLINAFLIIIIVGFLGFGATFTNASLLVRTVVFPILMTLLVPASIAVYSKLYSSTHYHVN